MVVVNLNNVKKSYGITDVLEGFSMTVTKGERVGLIGANGSGKTTIFKIIAGQEPYSEGAVSLKRDIEIGYLSQMPDFNSENTLYEELETVFAELINMKGKITSLEKRISKISNKSDSKNQKELEKLMGEYSKIQHVFESKGGYEYESKIYQVAAGLGFSIDELEKKVNVLSGGEKTRLGLVKLLLSKPQLLLLDEPTNHLDILAIQWLEDYLKDYQGAVIIISHDRYFLDQVVTRIVEVKNGTAEVYHGNYSYYLDERKRRFEQRMRTYQNQQKKIKKMEEAIDRLQRWGQQGDNEKFFTRAKSMQKSLDKLEKVDRPVLDGKKMRLDLDISKRSGDEVLIIKDCAKSFKTEQVLSDLDLAIYWGENSAVIGENGSGKTTLLKIIIGQLPKDKGEVKIGTSVKIGYYSQEFEGFNPEDDMITALRREISMSEGKARNILAGFLFTEDDVFKKVSTLSGGEKSRLRLLQLMHGDYNLLIMDEPTNHLDLPSREVLEEALQNYPGTIFLVSHDRYFLNKVIDYTYELENGNLTKYYGNYDYYRKKKEELKKEKENKTSSNSQPDNFYYRKKEEQKQERKRKTKLSKLEDDIMKMEEKKDILEKKMSNPENLQDYNLLNDLKENYKEINNKLKDLYNKWESYL